LKTINFNEDQLDALKEFMNISIGAAAANIAELLDAFATMHIPQISICNSNELIPRIQSEVDSTSKYYVTKQLFTGKFGGECMFVMNDNSAKNLGNHLYDVEIASQDDINDAVIELTNILSSTIISRLTQELDTQVQFFVPSSQYVSAKDIVHIDDISHYSKIIIISTVLEFKDQNIDGNIYILTKDEAIESLKSLIDKKLEELYS
jgi:chemotaxis protein CheC